MQKRRVYASHTRFSSQIPPIWEDLISLPFHCYFPLLSVLISPILSLINQPNEGKYLPPSPSPQKSPNSPQPNIRKTLNLPRLPGISTPSDYVDFGFGFDPSVQDFKFVRLVFAKSKTETGVKSVAIYTLGANSWKSVEFRGECSKDLMFYTTMRPIPLNSVVYTLAVTEFETLDTKLISFDLSSEVFSSFGLPASVGSGPSCTLTTVDEGCTLAVVSLTKPGGSVWVLERLGDDTKLWRWIRRYSFVTQHEEASDLKFLCIKKNGEMLLKGNNVVICHNLETQQEKVMLDKTEESFVEECAFPYMESLILHH